jgi:hypothetical protein
VDSSRAATVALATRRGNGYLRFIRKYYDDFAADE